MKDQQEKKQEPADETVEQYLARGGKITKLEPEEKLKLTSQQGFFMSIL